MMIMTVSATPASCDIATTKFIRIPLLHQQQLAMLVSD